MKRLITPALLAGIITSGAAAAEPFSAHFNDSTLRIDYILSGNRESTLIAMEQMSKCAGWAGRRHNLGKAPLMGNGSVIVTDARTGDTLYVNTFSTLYQEWLSTDQALEAAMAMEHTALVPLPKRDAEIELQLLNPRHEPTASSRHRFSPADVLVADIVPHDYPTRILHKGGDSSEAIDIAILAEGYTRAETDSFFAHAQAAADEILSYEPFRSHASDFNFIAVATPSTHSGVSVPRLDDWKSTPFSSHFSTFYSDRYLTTGKVHAIHDALAGVPYEHIIILANTDEYGGGGIYNSYTLTAARHPLFRPVVVHEFGHSFGGLGDEYFYEGDVMEDTYPFDIEPWEPNITTMVNFPAKWKHLLAPGTPVPTPAKDASRWPVGVYEGGGYSFKGIYRPADECRMRNNTYPTFCPACVDAMDRLIKFYIIGE